MLAEDPDTGGARTVAVRHGGAPALAALVVVVALAFGLRLEAALTPIEDPGTDSRAYAALAEGLYEHGRYEGEGVPRPSDWSPGAPLLFAGVYMVTGGVHPRAALVTVALIGSATVLLVYLLARRLAGGGAAGTAAGLVAAGLAAIYPTFIDASGRLLSEPLAALLLTAFALTFLRAADRETTRGWAPPGALLGALTLTRPEYLPLAPAFALLALALVWRSRGRTSGLAAAGVLAVSFAVVIVPWTVRNYVALDRVVPVSTGGGKALFIGTYLPGEGQATPTKERLIELYGGRSVPMEALLDRVASRYPELDRDQALARIGRDNLWRYAREQPVDYARMLLEKAARVWFRGSSPAAAPPVWVWMHRAALLLALVGLVLLARSRRLEVLLLALPIAAVTVLGALLLAVPRRNVPLMPLVFALAGAAVAWLGFEARRRVSERTH